MATTAARSTVNVINLAAGQHAASALPPFAHPREDSPNRHGRISGLRGKRRVVQ